MTGYGTHTVKYPHHRYWANLIDSNYPLAPCGVLSGGPNSGMQDPWVRGMGWKKGTISPAKCYLDHIEAWSVNECTINWNSPLAWLAGFLTQYTADGIIVGSTGNGSGLAINPQSTANTAAGGSDAQMVAGTQTVQANNDGNNGGGVVAQVNADQPARVADPGTGAVTGGGNSVLIIVGIVAGVVLILAIAAMVFIYKMTKLKLEAGNNSANK